MNVNNPASGASVNYSGTQVFSGTSPTSWTDLDVSAVTGAKTSLVVLGINKGAQSGNVAVRRNGDTDEYYDSSMQGAACGVVTTNDYIVVICFTDDAGVIEWRTEGAEATTVDVIGYIN